MEQSHEDNKKRLSSAKWEQLMDEWESSHLSQSAFCRSKEVSLHTFTYWRSKLCNTKKKASLFSPLNVVQSSNQITASQTAVLRLPNGLSLSIPPNVSDGLLEKIFKLLGLQTC